MKKRIVLPLLLMSLFATSLASCSDSKSYTCPVLSDTNALLEETPVTDSLAFPYESDYASKDFFETTSGVAYGKATLGTVTDGDTISFTTVNNHYIKCRLLGINTPESTAKVEEWGVKASAFCKNVMSSATDFCLVNDIDVYGKTDNTSSQRSLAFVWYKTAAGVWRNYNLEVVEQCYSKNQLFQDSNNLKYLSYFLEADEHGTQCKFRVYGTTDPDYKGSSNVIETTCYYVRHHYDDIGSSYTTGSSGSYLHVTAMVVGQIGDNLIVRDTQRDDEQDDSDALECMYVYAGYNSSMQSKCSVGDLVSFYCRTSTFPSGTKNIQFTDLETSTSSAHRYRFMRYKPGSDMYKQYVTANNSKYDENYSGDYDPLDLTNLSISKSSDLDNYFGKYAVIDVTVRNATYERDDDGQTEQINSYYKETKSSSTGLTTATTIYCYAANSVRTTDGTTTGVPLNLRLDESANPKLSYKDFSLGKTYRIKAYMASYYDNYQLQVFNNNAKYEYVQVIG